MTCRSAVTARSAPLDYQSWTIRSKRKKNTKTTSRLDKAMEACAMVHTRKICDEELSVLGRSMIRCMQQMMGCYIHMKPASLCAPKNLTCSLGAHGC